MKKILTIALCLIIALFTVGCTFVPSINLSMDEYQPWTIASKYEKCVYKVVKKNAKGVILGEGTLTNIAKVNDSGEYTTITSSFAYTPSDTLTPVVDEITSSAVIENTNCYALSSEKTVNLGSDPNFNYRFEADYETERKVKYYMKGSTDVTKTLKVPSSEKKIFDNEALYYVTRAFNPDDEKEGNFLLTNLYDCYVAGHVSSYSVYFRTSNTLITQDLFEQESNGKSWDILAQNQVIVDNKVECYHAKINRNRSNMSGAPVEMWFVKKPFAKSPDEPTKSGNKRVMVKMRTTTLTIPDANLDYTMEYDLIEYSTKE
jgi:hypothetical protein